jgi:DNA repair photolyase
MYKYNIIVFSLSSFLGLNNEHKSFYMSKNKVQSLEVSVKAGCGLMCSYCPQEKYIDGYKNKYTTDGKNLTPEVFNTVLGNIPKGTHIWWSAFTEPLSSKYFDQFCSLLKNNGYSQSISTTLTGTKKSIEWFLNNMDIFDEM